MSGGMRPARDDRPGSGLVPPRTPGGRANDRAGRHRSNPILAASPSTTTGTRHGDRFRHHDVGAAAEISDRIAVMYAGRFVESGTRAKSFARRDIRIPKAVELHRAWRQCVARNSRLFPHAAQPGAPSPGLCLRRTLSLRDRCVPASENPGYHSPTGAMARCVRTTEAVAA